jgi:hypothetical protein
MREISQHFGWSSPASAHVHMRALIKKGYLNAGAERAARGSAYTTPLGVYVPVIERLGEESSDRILVPTWLTPECGFSFAFLQPSCPLMPPGVLDNDMVLAAPLDCQAQPRLLVVSMDGCPTAVSAASAGRRKVHAVVAGLARTFAADSMR